MRNENSGNSRDLASGEASGKERTLVLIKPDGVSRGLIGEIIHRIERTGLRANAMKMLVADEKLAEEHYQVSDEWARGVFEKAQASFASQGKKFEHKNHFRYGEMIQRWNKDFLQEGPVVAVVFSGPHAVEIVRKIVGPTDPSKAPPGTIRGDFLFESAALANESGRSLRNLIHASGNSAEAEREIKLWFGGEKTFES